MSAVPLLIGIRNPEETLEALLPDIRHAVGGACRHYYVDQSEIDDFYNEIILLLIENDYQRLRSFRKKSSARTWLTAIALNYVNNHVSRRREASGLDEPSLGDLVCLPMAEAQLIAEEQGEMLTDALSELTRRERKLFALLCRDDLTSLDVAKQMSIKVESLRRSKHMLIKKLRGILNPIVSRSREPL